MSATTTTTTSSQAAAFAFGLGCEGLPAKLISKCKVAYT